MKVIKDFTNRKLVCKYLIEDELGIGWGQRPSQAAVDEQMLSLRRLAMMEQERKRKMPLITQVYSVPDKQLPPPPLLRFGNAASTSTSALPGAQGQNSARESAVNIERRRRLNMGLVTDYDHEYQATSTSAKQGQNGRRPPATNALLYPLSTARRRRIVPLFSAFASEHQGASSSQLSASSSSLSDQGCPVPEAECYIEVETASDLNPAVSAVVAENDSDSGSDSDDNSEKDDVDNEDDDSDSCSSASSVEIGLRITALTADIDQEPHEEIIFETGDQECQDLGNDVLPDGQVDFDLD